jgi:hypothetical protein
MLASVLVHPHVDEMKTEGFQKPVLMDGSLALFRD